MYYVNIPTPFERTAGLGNLVNTQQSSAAHSTVVDDQLYA